MNRNSIPAIIGIASVIIFFIWGFIEGTYKHAWIIFLVAGLAFVINSSMKKSQKDSKEAAPKEQSDAGAQDTKDEA